MEHVTQYFQETERVSANLCFARVDKLIQELCELRDRNGRLFILGVGGSAANATHAVNDFRKLCGIEAYAPTDNVSELTARVNDDGWHTVFSEWLCTSRINDRDALLIFSVGGGNLEKNVSTNLISAIDYAKNKGAKVFCIVGRSDGYAVQQSHVSVVVPVTVEKWLTPLAEAYQGVILHCLVSDPRLQRCNTKW